MRICCRLDLFIDRDASKPKSEQSALREIKSPEKNNDWIADIDDTKKIRDDPRRHSVHTAWIITLDTDRWPDRWASDENPIRTVAMNKKFVSGYQGIWLTRHPALRLISRNTLRDCYATPAYPSRRSNAYKFDGPGKLPPYCYADRLRREG